MKSPFVRFSQFIRSPLSVATIGLCAVWGCRHLPTPQYTTEYTQPADMSVAPSAPGVSGYEEPAIADNADPNADTPPIVSLSEGDFFVPLPSEPVVPTPPEAKAEEPQSEPLESVVAPKPVNELPKENAPTKSPAVVPKLEVPPEPAPKKEEPAPKKELSLKPDSELPVETKPQAKPKEVASVTADKPASADKPIVPIEPARPATETAVTASDNAVFSLNSYCDGLVFDSQGFGYVSHKNRIVRFSPTGESSVWATLTSPKGHRIEPEGTHLVCDVERRVVLRLSFEGKLVGVAAKDCDGAPFRAPYDIAVDPKGGFYFTDPGYVQIKNPIGKLHYVDRTGKVSVVASKIGYPTGIAYDPARQRVLVAESQFNRILEFKLSEPGKIESHEVLVQLPKSPDADYHLASLCLDGEGHLYVSQQQTKTVHVFDPQGRPAGRFSTGAVAPSSVALRSPDSEDLYFAGEADGRARPGKVIRLSLGK